MDRSAGWSLSPAGRFPTRRKKYDYHHHMPSQGHELVQPTLVKSFRIARVLPHLGSVARVVRRFAFSPGLLGVREKRDGLSINLSKSVKLNNVNTTLARLTL